MRAIQKEMGTKDDFKPSWPSWRNGSSERDSSKEATPGPGRSLEKLRVMSPMSAEATVVRNYIDWILALRTWGGEDKTRMDVKEAEKILDEDHYGLQKPKERILEYLAVQSLTRKIKGHLCMVGLRAWAKPSVAKSLPGARDEISVRLSLGGVRDEAEIRGHRRTISCPARQDHSVPRKAKSATRSSAWTRWTR